MSLIPSKAKEKIQANLPVLAINPFAGGFDVAELVSRQGIDILFIDCERAGIAIETVGPMARAAQYHGVAAVVRSKVDRLKNGSVFLIEGLTALLYLELKQQKMLESF